MGPGQVRLKLKKCDWKDRVEVYDGLDDDHPTEVWEFYLAPERRWVRYHYDSTCDQLPGVWIENTPEQMARELIRLERRLPQELINHLKERAARKPSPPPAASNWEADDQIVQTIRKAGERLTTDQLLYAMQGLGLSAKESTVKKRLAALVENKTLTNDPRAKPRGYGLPEWNSQIKSSHSS
jgi:hypothetical protein